MSDGVYAQIFVALMGLHRLGVTNGVEVIPSRGGTISVSFTNPNLLAIVRHFIAGAMGTIGSTEQQGDNYTLHTDIPCEVFYLSRLAFLRIGDTATQGASSASSN